jgi:hypothetical protein
MQNAVDLAIHVDIASDVVPDELEVAIAQVRHVGHIAGQEIVDPHDGETPIE